MSTQDDISKYLSAYNPEEVRAGLRAYSLALRGQRVSDGWKVWPHPEPPAPPIAWRRVNNVIQYRERLQPDDVTTVTAQSKPVGTRHAAHKKTDTSVKPVADLKCPVCGSEMFKEGICPGCEAGKRGLKIRLLCGDCEWSMEI